MRRWVGLCFFVGVGRAAPCSELDADLQCSACGHFITSFYAAATKHVFRSAKRAYKERLKAIYTEHAPDKLDGLDALLGRAKGKEHDLYARVCAKYGVVEEPADDKAALASVALTATVEAVANEQWAEMDDAGNRAFVDFQKAMSGGSITGAVTMGPQVSQKMAACYAEWARDYEPTLTAAIAAVRRPYDSQLHKTFCGGTAHACASDPDDFFEL